MALRRDSASQDSTTPSAPVLPTPDSGHLPSWQLLPLMANLFPGMSVEEVLSSQVANLARLQLERVVEHSMYTRAPQDILG